MFNPFKKKDNEFKLDELELPSMSENNEESTNPIINGANLNNQTFPTQNSTETNPMSSQEEFPVNNNPSPEFPNPFTNNNQNQNNNQDNSQMQNIHNDIAKAKLESMDSKVTLIDARLSSIEQKLEILNKLILEEVSDETKKKLKIDSMMNKIKN